METPRKAPEEETPVCTFLSAHPQAIARVRETLPEDDTLLDVSETAHGARYCSCCWWRRCVCAT